MTFCTCGISFFLGSGYVVGEKTFGCVKIGTVERVINRVPGLDKRNVRIEECCFLCVCFSCLNWSSV